MVPGANHKGRPLRHPPLSRIDGFVRGATETTNRISKNVENGVYPILELIAVRVV